MAELPGNGKVLGRGGVASSEDGVVFRDEVEDVVHLWPQLAVRIQQLDPGSGDAKERSHTVEDVFAAGDGRQPDDGGTVAQRGLDGGGVHTTNPIVAADGPEHAHTTYLLLGCVRDGVGREVVRLEDDCEEAKVGRL